MNLRWLILDYVPPDIKLTPRQRRDLRRKTKDADAYISWQDKLFGFLVSLPLILGWITFLFLTALAIPRNIALGIPLKGAVFPLVVAGIWVILTGLRWLSARRATFAALREMGYDVCLKCGYWLRGLGDEVKRCPECGWRREVAS